MGSYIYSVLCAAVFAAVIYAASPNGGRSGISRFVGFCGALCVALTVLSPLSGGVPAVEELFPNADVPDREATESSDFSREAESFAESIAVTFSVAYGVDYGKFSVSVDCAKGASFTPEKAEVIISEEFSAAAEAGDVLTDIYGITVTVRSDGG